MPVESNYITTEDWFKHFSSLFNDDSTNDVLELDADDGTMTDIEEALFNAEITEEEVLTSIKKLKASKSAGQDGIPPKFYIHAHDTLMSIMLLLCNIIFADSVITDCWNSTRTVPNYTKGDVNEATNCRGITLLDLLGEKVQFTLICYV